MPKFRVTAVTEYWFVADVEADDSGTAATVLGDQIRAGTIKPETGPNITDIQVYRYLRQPEDS